MGENRFYVRVQTSIEGVMFYNKCEIPIMIENISEDGMRIKFLKKSYPYDIKINDTVNIIFYSKYDFFKTKKEVSLSIGGNVRYFESNDKYIYLGCKVESDEAYINFVLDKKSILFKDLNIKYLKYL